MAMSKVSQHFKGSSDVQYLRCVTMINEREEKKSVCEVDKRKKGGDGRVGRRTIELFIPTKVFLETGQFSATLIC